MEALDLISYWHKTKNKSLSLKEIPTKSNKKFWWQCDRKHEWEMAMYQVSQAKNNPCPYCNNRKVLPGFNDIATTHPSVTYEWNDKNKLLPTEVYAGSSVKVLWICQQRHEWEAQVNSRTRLGTGCPYCKGTKLLKGFNDLAHVNPSIAKEWHPTKNGNLYADMVMSGSNLKAWWLGKCGHEWETNISNRSRTNNPSGCPVCRNQKVATGYNDFQTIYPAKAKLWHPTKNEGKPSDILAHSEKLYWWICDEGHEYQLSAFAQSKALSCQVCINRIVQEGYNDLGSISPEIAKEWHPTKNGDLKATQVSIGQPRRAWWQCKKGHEWQAAPNDRVNYKTQCPYCSNKKVLSGYNDLQTLRPELVKEWHPTKNLVKPTEVSVGSDVRISWICDKGHEWQAVLYTRTSLKSPTGCPSCAGTRLTLGLNDLATLRPELVLEWHPTKNGNLKPDMVTFRANKKVWWLCDKGHEWEALVTNRSNGKGCQKCNSANSSSKAEKEILLKLQEQEIEIVCNDRSILKGQELDFWLPEQKIAIEYNGLYWHSERAGKDKHYHYNKWLNCREQGIQLIQIWEDDWNRNPELIINMLLHKVGKSTQPRIYARKLKAQEITTQEARIFLEANHIQGWVNSTYYFGLKDTDGVLYAVLNLKAEGKRKPNEYSLTRYATSANVIGGFTKLLKFAETTCNPEKIVTFSDNSVSNGGLYLNNGFSKDKELAPDYSYFDLKTKSRKHKFLYRLYRFRNDPELTYVDGYTETQLAQLNNLQRIWDAGKVRWVKTYPLSSLPLALEERKRL